MTKAGLIALIPLLLGTGTADADKVYKWVDASGKVTYSSTPPPDIRPAQEISLPPPPSEESVDAQREREKALAETGDKLEQRRLEREALRADEDRADRDRAARERPAAIAPVNEPSGYDYGSGLNGGWIPTPPYPGPRPPRPERPVAPPVQGPTRGEHPAYAPTEALPVPAPRGR